MTETDAVRDEALTPQESERVARLRDMLRGTGTAAESKWMRGLRQSREAGVLFGAQLHAAERLRQGAGPTDLEKLLLTQMRALMSDSEIRASGQEYRSALADMGTLDIVPSWVTAKPTSAGITIADYCAHLEVVGAEAVTLPHTSIADIDAVAAGEAVDSDEFTGAVGDFGFGATVYTSAPPESTTPPQDPPFTAKIDLEKFYVRRAVGDQWGGKDEIYWTVAASSGVAPGRPYISQEFGSVKEGDTHTFATDKRTVFNGSIEHGLVLNLAVWEADQSGDEWYTLLGNALQAFIDGLTGYNAFQQIVINTSAPGPVGFALDLASFFVAFWEYFRNNDDLSCERVIILDRRALFTMWHRKSSMWDFNGDGRHELTVNYGGDRPQLPSGTLEYVQSYPDQSSWSSPVSLGWKSATAAALCQFQDRLHVLYVQPDSQEVMWSVLTDGVWAKPQRAFTTTTYLQPSMTVHNNALYAAVVDRNAKAYVSKFGGTGWSTPTRLGGDNFKTSHTVNLLSHDGCLIAAHVWETDDLALSYTTDPLNWSSARHERINGWVTRYRPSHADMSGVHWLHHTGMDGQVHVSGYRPSSDDFVLHSPPAAWHVNPGGTLCTVPPPGGSGTPHLWLLGCSAQGNLAATRTAGWGSGWESKGNLATGIVANEIAAVPYRNGLCVMYQR
ncbi:hypothetical protein [Streptomyces sp. C10-9-1]|uniref:hypothetical protein n=1 Tax=Streptomyces sp. C10-9-1 TaxID=1859285 RepID=UPI003F4A6D78